MMPSWEQFKIYLEVDRGLKIYSNYKSQFLYIKGALPTFDKPSVRMMLHDLKTRFSNDTVNKYRTMCKYIAEYLDLNFMDTIHSLSHNEPKGRRLLSKQEVYSLAKCEIPRKDYWLHNRRYKAIILALYYTGVRPTELCNLLWTDYDGQYITIRQSKTSKPRTLPVASRLQPILTKLEHISDYIFHGPRGQLHLQQINEELRARALKLKWTWAPTCYNFRHTFQDGIANNGATLKQTADLAGNSPETAAKYYVRVDAKRLKPVLESTHPGLKQTQSIDSLKAMALMRVAELVDMTKFEVELTIRRKPNLKERRMVLS